MTSDRLEIDVEKRPPTRGPLFSFRDELADHDGRAAAVVAVTVAMMVTMLVPAVAMAAIPAVMMAGMTMLLLDDHDVPCLGRGARDDRNSQAEGGDGSEGEYQLAQAFSPFG